MFERRETKQIKIGSVPIGGGAPVAVQSMTNTDTRDVTGTVDQILRLEGSGCEIIRVAVPDLEAARAIEAITAGISIPLIADIHFDARLAIASIEHGAQGIRINPGNIGGEKKLARVVEAAGREDVPIRVGVNSGSLEKDILARFGGATAPAMAASALRNIKYLEDMGYRQIKVSLKSSDTMTTVEAYRLLAEESDYPLHLGVTEAGGLIPGTVKSSVALGLLLYEGIGDTIRVSLTRDPEEEVRVGFEILRSLHLRERGPEIISCPTCGRCQINLFPLAEKVENYVKKIETPWKVAVMGCVVNGPGEAKEADIGIAGGKGLGIIFKKGQLIKKVPEDQLFEAFVNELGKMDKNYSN
ncbi:MAG: flavodoxin-dependent (E)-4-hydroxy-3-methylbut-2-enyl-diphosphate synthase [Desulfurivibrionaceae bacterium]